MSINEQYIINEELYPWEKGHESNPIEIDTVIAGPTLDLTDQKRDMDYYLEPHKWLNNHNIARTINSGYINTDQIHGWRPYKLRYNSGTYENRQAFRTAKQNAKHNKRMLKQAMKYAGSDQQSISDRHFYQKTLPAYVAAGTLGPTVGVYTVGNLLGAAAYGAYTAPVWGPWFLTNVVLPALGGEVVNDITRKVSDNYYKDFGDFVYRGTPLEDWTKDTWLEEPTKFVADMTNIGYWAPYRKIANGMFHSIPNWMEGKAYSSAGNVVGAQLFRNPSPKALTAAERLTQMVPPQHQASFVHGVEKGNQAMASLYDNLSGTQSTGQWFTTEGMPNPKTTFYSGFPINSKNTFNVTDYIKDFSNKINLYGIIPSHIKSTGFLQPSRKAINDYLNFKKNNPGLNIVYDITPEDVKLRFEDSGVTKIIDEAHNAVWTKNENGFLINGMPVDISKVRVLDDVALNGIDDLWLQDLSNTVEPGTVMLTGRIKDLRLNGNNVEPWFGFTPRYNYNSSYTARAERFLDEAIESASRNKDLESYVESLKNIRNQISDRRFDNLWNMIFADGNNNIRFSAYGKDMHINLPSSIEYRNGVWNHQELMPLVRENLDPNNVLGLFDRYPFRDRITDTHHNVTYYRRGDGNYYISGRTFSERPFNPGNVSIAPRIDFSQTGRDKLESYLRSVDSPDRLVLMGNVTGGRHPIDLSETPLSRFAPQRVDDHYSMVGISPTVDWSSFIEAWSSVPTSRNNLQYRLAPSVVINDPIRVPFAMPTGRRIGFNVLQPKFDIAEVDPKLRDNFINFVESYPGEKLSIDNSGKLEFLKKIYEGFGLGTLSDDIVEKAAMIAEKSAMDSAAIAPEISLVDQRPHGYDLIYYRKGKPAGSLETTYRRYISPGGTPFNASHIEMIKSIEPIEEGVAREKGVARSLYSSGLIYNKSFYNRIYPGAGSGIVSGEVLLSPEQTLHTIRKPNFTSWHFGNYGRHYYNNGANVEKKGSAFTIDDGQVYLVTDTTDVIPVKSKHVLHPHRIEFKDGKFSLIPLDLNDPSLYKSIVPLIGIGTGAAALSESDK